MDIEQLIAAIEQYAEANAGTVQAYRHFERLNRLSLTGMGVGAVGKAADVLEESGIRKVRAILEKNRPGEKLILFDVGANKGQYCKKLIAMFAGLDYDIHAFEPSSRTLSVFVENLHDAPVSIRAFNLAFGDADGTATLYTDAPESQIASLNSRRLEHYGIAMDLTETVHVRTIDGFCAEKGIDRIHFLKLDTEGHEIKCLTGAERMLAEKRIDIIQFEIGGTNIDSKTFLADFIYKLRDFNIYRVLRNGLAHLATYCEYEEFFAIQNFLAVRRDL